MLEKTLERPLACKEIKPVNPIRRSNQSILKEISPGCLLEGLPLLGIHTEETRIERDMCTPTVHRNTVYNSQDMEAT